MARDKIITLDIPPGFVQDGASLKPGAVRWETGNLVRFEDNAVVPIGGWSLLTDATLNPYPTLDGKPRAMHGFQGDSAVYPSLGIATHTKLYVIWNGALTDITPATNWGFTLNGVWQSGFNTGLRAGEQLTDAGTASLAHLNNRLIAANTNGRLFLQTGAANAVPVDATTIDVTYGPRAQAVVVTPERFIFALWAWSASEAYAQAPQRIIWASQGTMNTWQPLTGNTAGSVLLDTPGQIMAGRPTRSQTLIWTDVDLHVATYIGGDLVYRFDRVADNCGLLGRNSVAMIGDAAYWLSPNGFFMYDGGIKRIDCPIFDLVKDAFELYYPQKNKVWAVSNAKYNEVRFFLMKNGLEPDFYVAYNYASGAWTTGLIERGAGIDAGVFATPVYADSDDSNLYSHENANISVDAYVESTLFNITPGGETVDTIQRVIVEGEAVQGVAFTGWRGFEFTDNGDSNLTLGIASANLSSGGRIDTRYRGRIFKVRFAFNGNGTYANWKVGRIHIGYTPGSYR